MSDKARLEATVARLRNVRRSQTGARAAATQRKLDTAYQQLLDLGKCWKCGSSDFHEGGSDDVGQPITICDNCGERQEDV